MQKKFTTVCEISKLNFSIFFYREIINDSVSVVSLNLHSYIREVLYAITTFDKPVWISGPADKISFW